MCLHAKNEATASNQLAYLNILKSYLEDWKRVNS